MQKEIWKDIPRYEGIYQASTLGRIKSLIWDKDRVLKLSLGNHGYLSVGLKRKTFLVHVLIAITFLNHKPCGHKLIVDHKDFNKQNNNLSNLQITTQRENANKKHLKSSSKHTGVYWNKNSKKWHSQITINGKVNYLGSYDDEIDAAKAYHKAKKNPLLFRNGLPTTKHHE